MWQGEFESGVVVLREDHVTAQLVQDFVADRKAEAAFACAPHAKAATEAVSTVGNKRSGIAGSGCMPRFYDDFDIIVAVFGADYQIAAGARLHDHVFEHTEQNGFNSLEIGSDIVGAVFELYGDVGALVVGCVPGLFDAAMNQASQIDNGRIEDCTSANDGLDLEGIIQQLLGSYNCLVEEP